MAARRLIAVMLVMLFLSSIVAALAPPVEDPEDQTSTPTTTGEPLPHEPVRGEGEVVRGSIDADAKRKGTVEATVGDQVQLRVTSERTATVELVEIGPTDDVGPDAPARFDVRLTRTGTFPVELLESGRRIGAIEVSPRPAPKEPAPAPARDRP